jgi:hypothetical protein
MSGQPALSEEVQLSTSQNTLPSVVAPASHKLVDSQPLFDAGAVGMATFFGTPAAGFSLMALNYLRLGKTRNAVFALGFGIAVTGLVILLGWNLPQAASLPIALALVFGTRWSAQTLQGAAVQDHIVRGGRLGSKWTAFWIGAAFLVVVFGGIFLAMSIASQRSGVVIGTKDEVFYSGSVTREQAQALGNGLKSMGYFTDNGANVFAAKGADGTIVSFVVKDGTWNDPAVVADFEAITRKEAPAVGGLPITLHLVNASLAVEKSESLN